MKRPSGCNPKPNDDEWRRLIKILALVLVSTVLIAVLSSRRPSDGVSPAGIQHAELAAETHDAPVAARSPVPAARASFRTAEAHPAPVRQSRVDPGERWGMEVAGLQLAAQGALLSFRYKIVDPIRAGLVGLEGGSAFILDTTGRKIASRTVPFTGTAFAARHLNKPGSYHSTFFPNQAGFRKGDRVTVVLGRFRAENVRID